jgi:hypothetical protein
MMFISGELDSLVPFWQVRGFYDAIPPDAPEHWLIDIHRAGHSYANACIPNLSYVVACSSLLAQDQVNAIVERWATALFLNYVAGDDSYAPLLDPSAALTPDYTVIKRRPGTPPAPLSTALPLPTAQARQQPTLRTPVPDVRGT